MKRDFVRKNTESACSWNEHSSLNEWLHPVTFQRFLKNYLDKKPLYSPATALNRFDRFFGLDDFRQALKEELIPESSMRIFSGQPNGIPFTDYGVRQSKLFDRLRKTGHSVWIRDGITDVTPGLTSLYSEILNWTGHSSRMNLFFTPRGTHTFNWHWDPVDAMSLQLHGRKRWLLYERPFALPLPTHRAGFWPYWNAETLRVTSKIELKQGDYLYFPRGVPHNVASPPTHDSLHLTAVLLPVSNLELVQELFKNALLSCEQDLEFRKQIFLEKGKSFSPAQKNAVEKLAKKVFDRIDWQTLEYQYRVMEVLKTVPEDYAKVETLPDKLVTPAKTQVPDKELFKRTRLKFFLHKRSNFIEIIVGKQKVLLPLKYGKAVSLLSKQGSMSRQSLKAMKLSLKEQNALLGCLIENKLIQS